MNLDINFRDLMNNAYEIAKTNFGKKTFTFQDLWSLVWKKELAPKNEKVENWIGTFYTDLIQDKRFLVCGRTSWCLREFITTDEAERIANTLLFYEKDDIYEEDFEDYQSPVVNESESENNLNNEDDNYFNWNDNDDEETVNDIVQEEESA